MEPTFERVESISSDASMRRARANGRRSAMRVLLQAEKEATPDRVRLRFFSGQGSTQEDRDAGRYCYDFDLDRQRLTEKPKDGKSEPSRL